MDLIKDIIKVDNRLDIGRYQSFLECEIVVPDIKEDVFEIIKTQGYISLKKEDVMTGKVIIRGDVNYNIIYLTSDKKISSLSGKMDINEVLEKEDIIANMKPLLKGEIEHLTCNILNERKVKLGSLVNIKGCLYGRDKVDIVREIRDLEDIQTYREHIEYEDIIGIEIGETLVRESLQIDDVNNNIHKIVSLSPRVKLKETRISDNKVILGGVLKLDIIALNKEDNIIRLDNQEIGFTQFIEVPGAFEGMRENSTVELVDFGYSLKEDDEGKVRMIEIESSVKGRVKVCENVKREILQDAYCPYRGLKLEEKYVKLNKTAHYGIENFIIKENIQKEREDIDIKEILSVEPKIFVTDNSIIDGKNIIEGIMNVAIAFTPVEGLRPIYTINEEIPFKHSIELRSFSDGALAYGDVHVEDVSCNVTKGGVDIQVKAKTCFEIVEETKNRFVVDGELQGNFDLSERASITIYISKEGDTLWDVAKRYNATLEEIANTNELSEEEVLCEGQCLIIEKKVSSELF